MLRRLTSGGHSHRWLVAALLVALAHGLTYVFLVPPWQHYDEPTHFEYVWLVANQSGLPKPGVFDQNMRLQVAASMLEHGFYRDLGASPKLEDVAAFIGYTQLDDPPLYYLIASLPVRLLHSQSVTVQLYATRLVSLCLYLIVILIAWYFMGELVDKRNPLRWMVPITLALLPSFTDIMTAVNNDVGAVLVFSLFLWASVRLVIKGFSFFGFVFLSGTAALCYWTANTTWLALPLIPVVLLFSLLRGKWRSFAWIVFLATMVVGVVIIFRWGDAAFWYRRTLQAGLTRVVNPLAPVGKYAFQLDLSLENNNQLSIQQPLPPEIVRDLRNSTITVGAWVWSSQPVHAQMPIVTCFCGGPPQVTTRQIQAMIKPSFFSYSMTLPSQADFVWITLAVPPEVEGTQNTIFYDGLILIKGEIAAQDSPLYKDTGGEYVIWSGRSYPNLLRNSSAELSGPGLKSWVNKIGVKIIPAWPLSYPSDILVSLLDTKGASWYYQITSAVLLRSFWAKFGWGNVSLLGSKPYQVLAVATLLGSFGAAWMIWRKRFKLSWEVLLILGLALFGIWLPAILRGIGSLVGNPFFPVARYAFPAILPTAIVLNAGWLEIVDYPARWLRLSPKVIGAIYILLFIALDTLAFLSIFRFYY